MKPKWNQAKTRPPEGHDVTHSEWPPPWCKLGPGDLEFGGTVLPTRIGGAPTMGATADSTTEFLLE